jgi:hypothetical protein
MSLTIFNHTHAAITETISKPSSISRFLDWCEAQQYDRLLWLGIALGGQGCILTPITILAVVFAGLNLALFILSVVAIGTVLVTNLAALPTRITIPVLICTILIDFGIIIASVAMGLNAGY